MPTPALLTAVLGPLLLAPPSQETATVPPGFARIQGVRAKIGADVRDVEALIAGNEDLAKPLASETPQHTVQVEEFLLQVTEVTNEQYAVYVADAGVRPPFTWGGAAIEAARAAWFQEEKRKRDEAAAAGKRYTSSELFDTQAAQAWWASNWQEAAWEVPTAIANHPVTFVDHTDALGYARWAGVRLMTEHEFQAAARGASDSLYPWGDAWDPKKAAGLDAGRVATWPVGAFEPQNGVFDLIGNVWEWTSSPFAAYPGYKYLKVKAGRGRVIEALAEFDRTQRVVVGGDFHSAAVALRVTVRRNTDRWQRTDSLGFRCAASVKPGLDLAEYVTTERVSRRVFPDATFQVELPTVLHRWTAETPSPGGSRDGELEEEASGAAAPGARKEDGKKAGRPAGYAVITGYDALLFVPVGEMPGVNLATLASATEPAPVPLGVLYTSVPILEPNLEPGAYFLTYRAGAKLKELEEGLEPPAWRSVPGYDPLMNTIFVLDGEGQPLLALPGGPTGYERITSAGTATLVPWTPPAKVDENAPPPTPIDTVRLQVAVQGKQNNRGFPFDLSLKVAQGVVDASWGSK